MPDTRRQPNWTEAELVRVLALYCQLPFGKMHYHNPAVVRLADAIARTPSAVAMKLVNFASMDPSLQARGIRGMSNVSRLDRQVWADHYGNWDALAAVDVAEQAAEIHWGGRPTSADRLMTVRIGQGFFRNAVLAAYQGQCCITGIAQPALLRASHVLPWAADEARRLDPTNGLCLNALHDAAFDRGLIAVAPDLTLKLSKLLRDAMPPDVFESYFARHDARPIRLPDRYPPDVEALQYHFEHVFISDHGIQGN